MTRLGRNSHLSWLRHLNKEHDIFLANRDVMTSRHLCVLTTSGDIHEATMAVSGQESPHHWIVLHGDSLFYRSEVGGSVNPFVSCVLYWVQHLISNRSPVEWTMIFPRRVLANPKSSTEQILTCFLGFCSKSRFLHGNRPKKCFRPKNQKQNIQLSASADVWNPVWKAFSDHLSFKVARVHSSLNLVKQFLVWEKKIASLSLKRTQPISQALHINCVYTEKWDISCTTNSSSRAWSTNFTATLVEMTGKAYIAGPWQKFFTMSLLSSISMQHLYSTELPSQFVHRSWFRSPKKICLDPFAPPTLASVAVCIASVFFLVASLSATCCSSFMAYLALQKGIAAIQSCIRPLAVKRNHELNMFPVKAAIVFPTWCSSLVFTHSSWNADSSASSVTSGIYPELESCRTKLKNSVMDSEFIASVFEGKTWDEKGKKVRMWIVCRGAEEVIQLLLHKQSTSQNHWKPHLSPPHFDCMVHYLTVFPVKSSVTGVSSQSCMQAEPPHKESISVSQHETEQDTGINAFFTLAKFPVLNILSPEGTARKTIAKLRDQKATNPKSKSPYFRLRERQLQKKEKKTHFPREAICRRDVAPSASVITWQTRQIRVYLCKKQLIVFCEYPRLMRALGNGSPASALKRTHEGLHAFSCFQNFWGKPKVAPKTHIYLRKKPAIFFAFTSAIFCMCFMQNRIKLRAQDKHPRFLAINT